MGKIRKEWNKDLKDWVTWDEEKDLHLISVEKAKKWVKDGRLGKEAQYKYFSEHPDEIEDEKLFSELKKEFGDDNTEET